jgi:hypothetical protein
VAQVFVTVTLCPQLALVSVKFASGPMVAVPLNAKLKPLFVVEKLSTRSAKTCPAVTLRTFIFATVSLQNARGYDPPPQGPAGPPHSCTPGSVDGLGCNPVGPVHPLQLQAMFVAAVIVQVLGLAERLYKDQS